MCSHCMVEFIWHGCLLPAVAFLCIPRLRWTDIAKRASTAVTSSSTVPGIAKNLKSTEAESETLVMSCTTNGFLFPESGESHLR